MLLWGSDRRVALGGFGIPRSDALLPCPNNPSARRSSPEEIILETRFVRDGPAAWGASQSPGLRPGASVRTTNRPGFDDAGDGRWRDTRGNFRYPVPFVCLS